MASAVAPSKRPWTAVLRSVIQGWGLLAVAVVGVAAAAQSRNRAVLLVACALLVVAGLLFQGQLARRSTAAWLRLLVAAGLVVGGAVALRLWRGGGHTAGTGFLGVITLLFGAFDLLALLRGNRWLAPWRGVGLVSVGGIAALVGLVGFGYRSPGWALLLLLVGVLLVVLGVVLLSEDFLRLLAAREPGARELGALAAVGLVGLASALGAFVIAGAPLRYAFPLAVGLAVLVGALASRSDTDAVILVVAVVLVWSLLPRDASPLQFHPGANKLLVALGDSYISGEGAKRFYRYTNTKGDNECRRAPSAYSPQLAASGNGRGEDGILFLGCSGAEARDIFPHAQYPGEPLAGLVPARPDGKGMSQLAQYDALNATSPLHPDLVLVTIGGNDAGFSNLVEACVLPGDCAETGQKWLDRLAEVSRQVAAAYRQIRQRFPTVPVLAVPYPIQLNPAGCGSSLLTANEHLFLSGFVAELDSVIRHEAEKVHFQYVDTVPDSFKNNHVRICDGQFKHAGVNFFAANPVSGVLESSVDPQNWLHDSFHPNLTGQLVLQKTIAAWIQAHGPLNATAAADPAGSGPYVPPRLEAVMHDPAFAHCASTTHQSDSCHLDKGGALDLGRWTKSKGVQFARRVAIPAGGGVVGAWLLWMSVIALWHPFRMRLRLRRGVATGSPSS